MEYRGSIPLPALVAFVGKTSAQEIMMRFLVLAEGNKMANAWLDQIWPAVQGRAQMARRKITTVTKFSSESDLIAEARAKGFHVAKVGPQYVIFRHAIDVKC